MKYTEEDIFRKLDTDRFCYWEMTSNVKKLTQKILRTPHPIQVSTAEHDIPKSNIFQTLQNISRDWTTHKELLDELNYISKMDLPNIPFEKNDEIISFFKESTNWRVDIETQDWIKKFNKLFQFAVQYYKKRYSRADKLVIENNRFKSTNSILDFVKKTKTSKKVGLLYCTILKIWYSFEWILDFEILDDWKMLKNYFLEKYIFWDKIIPNSTFNKEKDKEKHSWSIEINNTNISFDLTIRQKSAKSIIWKQIREPNYNSIDWVKDLIWCTFFVDNEKELILLMKYVNTVVFHPQYEDGKPVNYSIEHKNLIEQDLIDKYFSNDNSKFMEILKNELRKSEQVKWNYKDIKLNWTFEYEHDWEIHHIWTEIKFVLKWQDHEKWLACHSIYEAKKVFKELTRLWIWVTDKTIDKAITNYFIDLEDDLVLKRKDKDTYFKELLKDFDLFFMKNNINQPIPKVDLTDQKGTEKLIRDLLYKYFTTILHKTIPKSSNNNIYIAQRWAHLKEVIN